MLRFALLLALAIPTPALAQGDELRPIPAAILVGKAYSGQGEASEIEFINTRRTAVRICWISFDGMARLYAVIQPGEELLQPTFVSHRWLVTRGGELPIEAFISTRSDLHSDGQPQIAIIR